jgi:PKD repeat protein
MTAFSGVDTAAPFDTVASTAVNKTYTTAGLTVPGVTTVTPGALLVGGIGLDSAATAVGAPTGWTEAFESSGAQVAGLGHRPVDTAGPTGPATWTLGKSTASAGWSRALRPATTSAPPAGPAVPAASFTASPASGQAPLPVRFTDTSTGTPTAWRWNFGDGGTTTTQHPEHVYASPGTYTVSLVATNGAGSSPPATLTITVGQAPPPNTGGGIRAGGSATASSAAATAVVLPRPAGVATGDVLVAQITADGAPAMSAVPAGWSPVLSAPLAIGTGARVFAYSHVVGDVAAEPSGYTWQLSAPFKWGAAVTAFSGVDTANPFDTVVSTRIEKTYGSTVLTVPGVVTATAGAVLVGGLGMDSSAAGVNPPAGWTETAESSGFQSVSLAHAPATSVGASGDATWTLPKATASGGWLRALRPAR